MDALTARIEQLTTIRDPEERERALSVVERDLQTMLSRVSTYRGDTQFQIQARRSAGAKEKE